MSTELATEVNRDPYPFPRLENDEKFGPTMVKCLKIKLNQYCYICVFLLVTSTNRKSYFEARRARPMAEAKSNTNSSKHEKRGLSLRFKSNPHHC